MPVVQFAAKKYLDVDFPEEGTNNDLTPPSMPQIPPHFIIEETFELSSAATLDYPKIGGNDTSPVQEDQKRQPLIRLEQQKPKKTTLVSPSHMRFNRRESIAKNDLKMEMTMTGGGQNFGGGGSLGMFFYEFENLYSWKNYFPQNNVEEVVQTLKKKTALRVNVSPPKYQRKGRKSIIKLNKK